MRRLALAAAAALALSLGQGCAAADPLLSPKTASDLAEANNKAARELNKAGLGLEAAYADALDAAVAPCAALGGPDAPAFQACAAAAAGPVDERYEPVAKAYNATVALQNRVADAVVAYVACVRERDAVCAAAALSAYAGAWAEFAPKAARGAAK